MFIATILVENEVFEQLCKHNKMGVNFEHTMPIIMQKNGLGGRQFSTPSNWVHVKLNGGKFSQFLKISL